MKAGKYRQHLQDKAAYEVSRPTEPTYHVDETDDVFQAILEDEVDGEAKKTLSIKPRQRKRKKNTNRSIGGTRFAAN